MLQMLGDPKDVVEAFPTSFLLDFAPFAIDTITLLSYVTKNMVQILIVTILTTHPPQLEYKLNRHITTSSTFEKFQILIVTIAYTRVR